MQQRGRAGGDGAARPQRKEERVGADDEGVVATNLLHDLCPQEPGVRDGRQAVVRQDDVRDRLGDVRAAAQY